MEPTLRLVVDQGGRKVQLGDGFTTAAAALSEARANLRAHPTILIEELRGERNPRWHDIAMVRQGYTLWRRRR